MTEVSAITVNGIEIPDELVHAEMQYHPAKNLRDAQRQAMQALVIKELLLQEAVRRNVGPPEQALREPEAIIEKLLGQEISVPQADEKACRRYYDSNPRRFHTAPLFQVSHILFPAPPGNAEMRGKVREEAKEVLRMLEKAPSDFAALAREYSACSSAENGGALGQITKGQTLPAFEAALFGMQAGDLSAVPVETEVGFHIIKVHAREDGRDLPFEAVKDWIASFLEQSSWQRAVSQYIRILAGKAEIQGFQLDGADTPLVQ